MKRGAADYVIKALNHIQRLPYTIRTAVEQRKLAGERDLAQRSLHQILRARTVMAKGNQVLFHARSEQELLAEMCRTVVEDGGYRMAWIGFIDEDAVPVVPAAYHGVYDGYLEAQQLTWGELKHGSDPCGAAIRTGRPAVAKNLGTDPSCARWREQALKRGYQSLLALSLCKDGKAFGELTLYAAEPDGFDAEEQELLEELAADIAYGIVALRLEAERRRTERRLHTQYAVTRALSQAAALPEAARTIVGEICRTLDWDAGELWIHDRQHDVVRCAARWPRENPGSLARAQARWHVTFARGLGLPGRVWAAGEPVWIPDLSRHEDLAQLTAAMPSVRSGFGLPIQLEGQLLAVITVFSATTRRPDLEMTMMLDAIAGQIAAFLKARRAEEAVRLSEEKLSGILGSIDDIVWSSAVPDHRILFLNAAGERVFGRSGEDFYRDPQLWFQQIHDDDRKHVAARLRDLLAAEKGTLHYRIVRPDGAVRWLEDRVTVVREADGHPLRFDGVATDVTERTEATHAAEEARRQRELILESVGEGIHGIDLEGNIVFENRASAAMLGWDRDELLGRPAHSTMHHSYADGRPYLSDACPIQGTLTDGIARVARDEVLWRKDGSSFPVDLIITPMRDEQGAIAGTVVAFRDMTQGHANEAARREAEGRLNDILATIDNVVWSEAADTGELIYINAAAEKLFGCPIEALRDRAARADIVHAQDRTLVEHRFGELLDHGASTFQYRILRPDGQLLWLEDRVRAVRDAQSRLIRFDGVTSDISKRKAGEARIEYLANYDELTGLPNRNLLADRIVQSIARAGRSVQRLALLFLDLDRFKLINDGYGHPFGDRLLTDVGRRLKQAVRTSDTVARLGGDEFLVLVTDLARTDDASNHARRLIAALAEPFDIEGHRIHVTASIGISIYPDDGDSSETLLKNADTAMYRAKEHGRDAYQFYTQEMSQRAREKLELDNALWRALEQGEFELHYQPKVRLTDGAISGVEALIRWGNPERGMVEPAQFIPFAEESGLVVPIGEWVLREACAQLKRWHVAGHAELTVAVNLSARQFRQQDLPALVHDVLAESGLDPARLELEVTESALMHDSDVVVRELRQLSELGVTIALDDFGTGYSSLSYLKRFPIDSVKIDRAFLCDVTHRADAAALTQAIIAMARSLGMQTIAEGVETEGQLRFLRTHGCDAMQGYLFSAPLSAAHMADLLASGRRLATDGELVPGKNRTLLLVDDEENILSALKRVLHPEGYHILTATSAEQAFELLGSQPAGVIVSDQGMPGITGVQFLREVKHLHPDTVRIVLSGHTELASVTTAVNEGSIYKFLTKPWEDDELRTVIAEAFHQHDLIAENQHLAAELTGANQELMRANADLQSLLVEKSRLMELAAVSLRIARKMSWQIPVPVIGIDGEGQVAFANETAEQLLKRDTPLLGQPAPSVLPPALAAHADPRADSEHVSLTVDDSAYRLLCRRTDGDDGNPARLMILVPQDASR
jgi:diguanylate cyclase (GGDEF)-like protein/PAS domain S-box-containing protein